MHALCRGCHKDAHPFFFILPWHPLSDVGGYPPTAIGYPPTAIGYPPTAIGYTPTAIGYPPTAIGYTPTAIGYPPAAIVGRIGHSEFFYYYYGTPWPCVTPPRGRRQEVDCLCAATPSGR